MTTKTTNIFLSVLFAICIAPACSRAQFLTSSDLVTSSGNSLTEQGSPNPQPDPTGENKAAVVITAPNAIYLELLGSGLAYSINYDRMLADFWAIRVGFGYLPVSSSNSDGTSTKASITTVPITISIFPTELWGAPASSKLEIGAGIFYADLQANTAGQSARGSFVGETMIFDYRLEPPDGGFLFRAGFTPFILNGKFQPYFGLSLGYAF